MANRKIKTVLEEVVEKVLPTSLVTVELQDQYKGSTSIILRYNIVTFIDNKAEVTKETAEILKSQNFIK